MSRQRTILVTGGCGFIGSHLCAALAAGGDQLRVLDDFSTGRMEHLLPGTTLFRGDIADRTILDRAMEGVDACFHLAAIASVERAARDWVGTHRTNLSGTIAVFDAARAAAVARGAPVPVIYASSAAVYGDAQDLPIDEETPPSPLSAYGADKFGCELHARVAGRVHGVPTVGLRFFNVFGPRQDPASPYSGVISIFCDRVRRGQPVTIFGDGGQRRDFIHVLDVVAALLAALPAAADTAPVFNVCSGKASSISELLAMVGEICGVIPHVRREPPRNGDIRASLGSPLRARTALGLPPTLSLEEGLRDLLESLGGTTGPRTARKAVR